MMEGRPPGVPAAPNRSEIRGRVEAIELSPDFVDKWLLSVLILESRSISGPDFVRVGREMKAFAFDLPAGIRPGRHIEAEAEFVGDEHGGLLRLMDVRITGDSDRPGE